MKYSLLVLILGFGLFSFRSVEQEEGKKISSAEELIRAMRKEARKSPLQEYTFIQETTRYNEDGTPKEPETWYEAVKYPDMLRIDIGDPSNGRTVIYRDDSAYFFKDHQLQGNRHEVMEFLLLEGGLKHYSVSEILERMENSDYDLGIFRTDNYQGRKVYVIGAEKGDLKSKQVWIDQERLTEVRRIDIIREDKLLEVQYLDYQKVLGAWVPVKIDFFIEGKMLQREIYNEITGNPGLKPVLFDPSQIDTWHWYGKKD